MKTQELVLLLARDAGPVDSNIALRRFALALAGGLAGSVLLLFSLLRIRSDLAEAIFQPLFWVKIGFLISLFAVSLFGSFRLSRPGSPVAELKRLHRLLATPLLLMGGLALLALWLAAPDQRAQLFFGETWRYCPVLIAVLSVPAFAALLWAMKGLAPTHPRRAGFTAGLLAGALAALVYSLHCPEGGFPFIGFWYVLGMLIPAGVGAWLGDRLLRW